MSMRRVKFTVPEHLAPLSSGWLVEVKVGVPVSSAQSALLVWRVLELRGGVARATRWADVDDGPVHVPELGADVHPPECLERFLDLRKRGSSRAAALVTGNAHSD